MDWNWCEFVKTRVRLVKYRCISLLNWPLVAISGVCKVAFWHFRGISGISGQLEWQNGELLYPQILKRGTTKKRGREKKKKKSFTLSVFFPKTWVHVAYRKFKLLYCRITAKKLIHRYVWSSVAGEVSELKTHFVHSTSVCHASWILWAHSHIWRSDFPLADGHTPTCQTLEPIRLARF